MADLIPFPRKRDLELREAQALREIEDNMPIWGSITFLIFLISGPVRAKAFLDKKVGRVRARYGLSGPSPFEDLPPRGPAA